VHEARYLANEVTHAAMEPHSTLAAFEFDPHSGKPGRLTVWSSTQVPYYLQHKLSLVLDMPMAQIRVIKPLVGGGFGGKSEVIPLELIAAIAARAARAPLKITYTREEVFWAHRGRPRTIVDLKTGVKSDGRLVAVRARVVQDGGAYCSYGPATILYSGALLGALYDIPNVAYDGYRVLTNKPACGAMRGHGTVNVRFAFESQLDEIAAALGVDPAEIRRRNLLQPPCITVNGLRVLSYGLPECIEKVTAASGWRGRNGKANAGSAWDAVKALAPHGFKSPVPSEPALDPARAGGRVLCGQAGPRHCLFAPAYVLALRGVASLRGILPDAGGLAIGALTSLSEIENSPVIRRDFPVWREAAATVASPILRNMGTLGGNICLDTRCLWYNQSLAWRASCGFCLKKDGDLCHVAPGGTRCWAGRRTKAPPRLPAKPPRAPRNC
jgi:CO/xanthine dehydrogenase Mo-binding subunit